MDDADHDLIARWFALDQRWASFLVAQSRERRAMVSNAMAAALGADLPSHASPAYDLDDDPAFARFCNVLRNW